MEMIAEELNPELELNRMNSRSGAIPMRARRRDPVLVANPMISMIAIRIMMMINLVVY